MAWELGTAAFGYHARALALNSGSDKGPLAIRDMRRRLFNGERRSRGLSLGEAFGSEGGFSRCADFPTLLVLLRPLEQHDVSALIQARRTRCLDRVPEGS
jgi:hypothetical protein